MTEALQPEQVHERRVRRVGAQSRHPTDPQSRQISGEDRGHLLYLGCAGQDEVGTRVRHGLDLNGCRCGREQDGSPVGRVQGCGGGKGKGDVLSGWEVSKMGVHDVIRISKAGKAEDAASNTSPRRKFGLPG